ncbi:MAG: quinolinate synthase NadA [Candidatus Diapherotrites archaeon]
MNNEKKIEKIIELKNQKNAAILAHNYQIPEIQELADYVADSLGLAKKAQEINSELIVLCGADFMAETAKALNPKKKILIPSLDAKCPMAGMLSVSEIEKAKQKNPNAKVVLYVNSSIEARAHADVCCTSANAVEIVNAIDGEEILFGPDKNLGLFVKKHTDKKIIHLPENGFCYAHKQFTKGQVSEVKAEHPDALILVHPECEMDVQDIADFIGSTSQMLTFAKQSNAKEFIIGTEVGLLHQLEKQNPEKRFYTGCEEAVCIQQKKINLGNLLESLEKEQYEVKINSETAEKAGLAIRKMFELV